MMNMKFNLKNSTTSLAPKFVKRFKRLKNIAVISIAFNLPILILYQVCEHYSNSNEAEISTLTSSNASLSSHINDLQNKLNDINKTKEIAQKLKDNAFINKSLNLDKVNQMITELSVKHRLINRPSVIIKPLLEPSQLLQLALKNSKDMKIEGSEISVEMNAYNDVDILQFVSTFLDNFDDVIKITSFEIKKNKDVDDITLASIEKGEKPVIVTAKLTITWQTIKFDQPILDKKDQAVAKEKD